MLLAYVASVEVFTSVRLLEATAGGPFGGLARWAVAMAACVSLRSRVLDEVESARKHGQWKGAVVDFPSPHVGCADTRKLP